MAARFPGAVAPIILLLAFAFSLGGCFVAATPSATTTAAVQESCVPVNGGLVSWWDGDHVGGSTAYDIWGGFNATMTSIGSIPGEVGNAFWFAGYGSSISTGYTPAFSPGNAVSVVAWVNPGYGTKPVLSQTILEQGARQNTAFTSGSAWASYDASNTDGAAGDKGFVGNVFDGRYVYFVPNYNGAYHGKVLRYDTTGSFSAAGSWASYDASNTDGAAGSVGFSGAIYDGRYVYFVPSTNVAGNPYGEVLRYDTSGGFTTASSWTSYNAANTDGSSGDKGFSGGVFDGRYVYFIPIANGAFPSYDGEVLRYDTTGGFTTASSWASYNAANTDGANDNKGFIGGVFDGRYVYFAPFASGSGAYDGKILRYDTLGGFTTATSWASYDASNTDGAAGDKGFGGAIFDGRYVYFVPCNNGSADGKILRYDTTGVFTAGASWTNYNAGNTDGSNGDIGMAIAAMDGRYIYFLPDYNTSFDGETLRYDTTGGFTTAGSWTSYNAVNTDSLNDNKGYQGAAFDGRFLYYAPYYNNSTYHGKVLRYDTVGTSSAYALRLSQVGSQSYAFSATGPAFQVNTSNGYFAANSKTLLAAGWHLVAGVYDGSQVALYVDGALLSSVSASGSLVVNTNNVTVGTPGPSNTGLYGGLDEVQLYNVPLSAGAIANIYQAGPNGVCK